jgi:hypothetical protein
MQRQEAYFFQAIKTAITPVAVYRHTHISRRGGIVELKYSHFRDTGVTIISRCDVQTQLCGTYRGEFVTGYLAGIPGYDQSIDPVAV